MTKPALLQRQFLVFIAGGGLSALVDIGLMQILLKLEVAPVAAASLGFVGGLMVNYAFHAKVTFQQLSSKSTVVRYLCVVAANYLITVALVALGQALLQSPLAGKLVSLPLVAVNGFLLSKFWVFK